MKRNKMRGAGSSALVAMGVFLGHGAHASTVLDFNALPADQTENSIINQGFGSFATASSDGYTVTGIGTPNIGLTWAGIGAGDTEWDYYYDGGNVWTAVQLNDSDIGDSHTLTLTPNSASAAVTISSFDFDPYYVSSERFTYSVSVTSGTNVLSGPTLVTFLGDALPDHPVDLNYTGAPGQALELRLDRIASTLGASEVEGGAYNIAVDNIAFAQAPETAFPAGPQVVAVTPANDSSGLPAISYPYLASITNGAGTTVAGGSIELRLDGTLVSPAPVVSSSNGLTNVSYPGTTLLSSGGHAFALSYQDNNGVTYTNITGFSAVYSTLPAAWALPEGSGSVRGFTYLITLAPQDATNTVLSTIVDAIAQLNGTLIDPSTGSPYLNLATKGPNSDGSYNEIGVINYQGDGFDEGDFTNDLFFPGIDTNSAPFDWFSTKATMYLDLAAGYYRLGVNSDDGFEVNALPPSGVAGSPLTLGVYGVGRGAGDTYFDVLAPTSGLYPIQVIYFQATGDAEEEFFSTTNFSSSGEVLVNDPLNPNAIVAYRTLALAAAPTISGITQSGANVVVSWNFGTPPYQVQIATNLNNPTWTAFGAPTTNQSATIPVQAGNGFIRVAGQ